MKRLGAFLLACANLLSIRHAALAEPAVIQMNAEAPAATKDLRGHVTEKHARIGRPDQIPLRDGAGSPAVPSKFELNSSSFKLDTSAQKSPPEPSFAEFEPDSQPHPALPSDIPTTNADPTIAAPLSASAVQAKKPPHPSATKREITIRLKRFRSLQEMEVVYEALKMANRMVSHGAEVTVLLDMEAVHSADLQDTAFAEFQKNLGESASSTGSLQTVQALMREFIANGGTVVASERWMRLFYVKQGEVVPGVKLMTDDEIAELLLNTRNILDY